MRQPYPVSGDSIGVMTLDRECRLVGFDATAQRVFGESRLQEALGSSIQALHPERSRRKVEWLLQQAQSSHEASMLVRIADRLLQLRVIGLADTRGASGYCLLLQEVTKPASRPSKSDDGGDEPATAGCLYKLPVSKHDRIALLDMSDVALLRAQGHYTDACAGGRHHFCGLSLSQLEPRLPPGRFVKVHRSCIVNLAYATAIERRDDRLVLSLAGLCAHAIPVSRGKVTHVRALLGV